MIGAVDLSYLSRFARMSREALQYARMPFALLSYLRAPRTTDPAEEIRVQFRQRETRFLDTLRRTIFANPTHPYYSLFQVAGCAFGDLASAVQRDGLEPTLEALRREGVFLTHDEFKGRAPIVRSGRYVPADGASWSNPLVSGGLPGMSSGSSGQSVATRTSIAFMRYQEAQLDLVWREFELAQRAHAEFRTILPSLRAFELALAAARLGHRIDRWFPAGKPSRYATPYDSATRLMVATANLAGARMPYPEPLPPNDFLPVAAWIARQREKGVSCALTGFVSPAVRIAATAIDHGLDIRGTIFFVGGEALTFAKRATVEAAGAEIYPRYHTTEIGNIGHACRQMRTGNSVHLYREAVAVIVCKRPAPLSGVEVDSLHFTALLASAPRILINVEMEDSGVISESRCDCAFACAGLTTVIHDIASFGKLTGQGVTLVGTDLVSVLEQRLPALLGGRVGDFQLVEREAAGGTQIVLYVSPRVAVSAEAARQCFLEELRSRFGGSLAVGLWTHAQALEAVIEEPIAGSTGKVLPLHLLGVRRDGEVPGRLV
jgi:hypothetical protein